MHVALFNFVKARKAAGLLFVLLACAPLLPAATLVHDFYLPMPEAQIRQTFSTLETNVGTTLDSVFSVVVTGPGTAIHYDQWEDGYETDLANPTQPSTQIWGDGNNANGIPPGFVNDPVGLPAGTVLALRNLVPLPRNPSVLLFARVIAWRPRRRWWFHAPPGRSRPARCCPAPSKSPPPSTTAPPTSARSART